MKSRLLAGLAAALVVAVGLAQRVSELRRLGPTLDHDEAVVALMARHIVHGVSRPVFYYGQPYLGALEAWLGAASGLGDEPSAVSIRAMLVGVWLLLLAAAFALARRAGCGPGAALVAPLLMTLVPPDVLAWQLKLRGGFLLGALLFAAALAQGLAARVEPASGRAASAFGFLAGLAAWTNQLTVPGLAVIGVAAFLRSRRRWLLAGTAIAGMLPLLVYNAVHPLATLRYLVAHAAANAPATLEHTSQLVTATLPHLLGGGAAGPFLWLAPIAALLLVRLHALRSRPPLEGVDLLLAALLVTLPARRNAELNQCLHWLPLLAALLAVAPRYLGRWWLACPLVAAALGAGETLARPAPPPELPRGLGLARELLARGIHAAWTEHRPAYLLAWYSGETIAASPALSYGYFNDRWPPYTAAVIRDPHPAWVFESGSPNEERFRELLASHGVEAAPETIDGYDVYTGLEVPWASLTGAAACGIGAPAEPAGEIELRVLLAGDAGDAWRGDAIRLLGAMGRDAAEPRARRRVVVWLGDNVYPRGLPASGEPPSPERKTGESVLAAQIDLVLAAGAEGVMVPGNHDWDRSGKRGWERVKAEEAFVRERGRGRVSYLPAGACPGPARIDLGARLWLFAADSEWLLRPATDDDGRALKPWGPGAGCDAPTAEAFYAALETGVAAARDRDVLVVMHHPVRTHGPHEYRGLPEHLVPCVSHQDLCGEEYRALRQGLGSALARAAPPGLARGLLLVAGGHDHSLQVLSGDPADGGPDRYLVSGASQGPTSVRRGPDTRFASSRVGFLRIDWLASGERWLSAVEAGPSGEACLAYEERLAPPAPH